jgi:hypothetical protein
MNGNCGTDDLRSQVAGSHRFSVSRKEISDW